jgi:hypothetical protein
LTGENIHNNNSTFGDISLTGRSTSQCNKKKTPPPHKKNEFLLPTHKRDIWCCRHATGNPKATPKEPLHPRFDSSSIELIINNHTSTYKENNTLLFVNNIFKGQRDKSAIFSLLYEGKMTVIQAVKK